VFNLVLALAILGADQHDANNPSQTVVKALRPAFGPKRAYDPQWSSAWVRRCQNGHIPHSEGYCRCLIESGRFYWDYKAFKIVVRNVRDGSYVPDVWFDNEEICWKQNEWKP